MPILKPPIRELAARMHALEDSWRQDDTGLDGPSRVESPFGPLRRARLHEWFGYDSLTTAGWVPPLAILSDLADRSRLGAAGRLIIWIGRAVWPYASVLKRQVLAASVWVDPPDAAHRLWAIDLAMRSEASAAVVADGSALDVNATRRLQLASEAGGALALVTRPPRERSWRSAAATRWQVSPEATLGEHARWKVELLRCKGSTGLTTFGGEGRIRTGGTPVPPGGEQASRTGGTPVPPGGVRQWSVEKNDGEGLVGVPAGVADRTTTEKRRSA